MKTDSAVALKLLNAQSMTKRSRTAIQKLASLREVVYQTPNYIAGQLQRADGQKILWQMPVQASEINQKVRDLFRPGLALQRDEPFKSRH